MPGLRPALLHGQRPGTRDIPSDKATGDLAREARRIQQERDRQARQNNPAYGNLNLAEWSEGVSSARVSIPPPGGRPRRRTSKSPCVEDGDEL